MNQWEKFVELYKDINYSTSEIKEILGLSQSAYKGWSNDFAREYGYKRARFGRGFTEYIPSELNSPKYYSKSYKTNKYTVQKQGKYGNTYYGRYNTEEEAKKVVEFLKQHDWSKESLKELKL